MGRIDVVVSGYVSMDRIIEVDTQLRPGRTSLVLNRDNATIHYGGCSVNIAYGLARLGLTTRPCIRVGSDYVETGLERFLLAGGVDTAAVTCIPHEMTSNCYLVADASGEHVTIYYPGAMDASYFRPLDPALFDGARLGVITVGSEPDNREFLRRCQERDLSVAFGMKGDLSAFPAEFLSEVLTYSSVIFLNEAESVAVQEMLALKTITDLFGNSRAEMIVVTGGARGSMCHQLQGERVVSTVVRALPGERKVDATGCGDAYVAGFLYGYLHQESGKVCAQLGATMASFVLQARGCCTAMPSRQEFWQRYHHHFQEEISL